MTVADIRPAYRMCLAGLHEVTPDNTNVRNGRGACRACEEASAKARTARVRNRMTQLLVGFAYRPTSDWVLRSACSGADPALFDLADKDNGFEGDAAAKENTRRHALARVYCETCPVVAECLGANLVNRSQGTRGGELLTDSDWKRVAHTKILKELGL